jgi:hypothetical protein
LHFGQSTRIAIIPPLHRNQHAVVCHYSLRLARPTALTEASQGFARPTWPKRVLYTSIHMCYTYSVSFAAFRQGPRQPAEPQISVTLCSSTDTR